MFTKQTKTSQPRGKVLMALGVAAVASLGYMGYEAFKPARPLALDLDSLPTDNKAAWDEIAQVNEALETMKTHIFDYTDTVSQISKIRVQEAMDLYELVGGVEDPELEEDITQLNGLVQTPKSSMATVVKGIQKTSEANRESNQMMAPENVGKAMQFVLSQRGTLEKAGISISQELSTLQMSNTRFRHITIQIGGLAKVTFQEAQKVDELITHMIQYKNNDPTVNKLFDLTFKRLLRIVETTVENLQEMEEELKSINLVMQDAISKLRNAQGAANDYYQQQINKASAEKGRANLKIKQLLSAFERESNKEPTWIKARVIPEPADPTKLVHYCNAKEIISSVERFKTINEKKCGGCSCGNSQKEVFSHMEHTYRDCDTEKAAFQAKNQQIWAQREAAYREDVAAAQNEHNAALSQFAKQQMLVLEQNIKQQEAWEEKQFQAELQESQALQTKTLFAVHMETIIQYQETVMASQQRVIQICVYFRMSINSSLKGLKDTAGINQPFSIGGPNFSINEEETNLLDWDKKVDDMADNINGEYTDADFDNLFAEEVEEVKKLPNELYFQLIQSDVKKIMQESYCTQKKIDAEIDMWPLIASVGYHNLPKKKLPKMCADKELETQQKYKPQSNWQPSSATSSADCDHTMPWACDDVFAGGI